MKGVTPLMLYVQEDNLQGVRMCLRDHPEMINMETRGGKTALAMAIVRYNDANWGWMIINEERLQKRHYIYQDIIQHGGRIGGWCNFNMPNSVLEYMQKIRRRRLLCAASMRTLLGIKKFRKPAALEGANRDVMLLITKILYREAGKTVEWDEEEIAKQKKKLK